MSKFLSNKRSLVTAGEFESSERGSMEIAFARAVRLKTEHKT